MPIMKSYVKKREEVIDATTELINKADIEIAQMEEEDQWDETQKKRLKEAFADLLVKVDKLGKTKGIWPKFVYLYFRNPDNLLRSAEDLHNKIKVTSLRLKAQATQNRLSTPISPSNSAGSASSLPPSIAVVSPRDQVYADSEKTPTAATFSISTESLLIERDPEYSPRSFTFSENGQQVSNTEAQLDADDGLLSSFTSCAPIALFGSLEIDNEQSEASLRRLPSLVSIPDSLVSTGNYETAPSSPMEGNVMAEKDDAFEVGFEY